MKRKFLEAALRYYGISQIEKRQIGDEYVLYSAFYLCLSIFVNVVLPLVSSVVSNSSLLNVTPLYRLISNK